MPWPQTTPNQNAGAILAAAAWLLICSGTDAASAPRDRFSPYGYGAYRSSYDERPDLYQRLRSKPAQRRAPAVQRAPSTTAHAVAPARPSQQPAATAADPLTIVVSVGSQRVTVFSGTDQVARASVSTGTRGHETPTGIFTVIQKERMHYSNLYNNAPMPFMQRLTWSGIALHAGHLPGYPASHGCVRMPHEFARRLYGMTSMGARVIVTGGDATPVELSHARLAAMSATRTQLASSGDRLEPPMHLGVVTQEASVASDKVEAAAARPSLLAKAQQHVGQRTLALEAARIKLETSAQPLADATQIVRQAREAAAAGHAEVARARVAVRRIEAEIEAIEARFKALQRAADGGAQNTAALEDRLEDSLQRLTAEVEPARFTLTEKDETLREITDELAQAEVQQRELQRAQEDAAMRLKIADEDLKEARRDLTKRQRPISLLVSRKTGKVYVRQGFEPLLEAQISLDEPDAPIGTHLFTAAAGPGGALRWTAVSVPSRTAAAETPPALRRPGRAERDEGAGRSVRALPITASAALDRLQLPADILADIGDLIKPGSSLIISDEPLSRETGKHTDLIVQTR